MTLHSDLEAIAVAHGDRLIRRGDNSIVISAELASARRLIADLAGLGIHAQGNDRLLAACVLPAHYPRERLLARLLPSVNDAALAVVGTLDTLQTALDEVHAHGHTEMLSDSLLEHVRGQRVPPQTVAQLCDPKQPWTVTNATIDWVTDTALDQFRDAPFGQPITGTQQQEVLARLIVDRAGVNEVVYTASYYDLAKALVQGIDLVETARLLARDTTVSIPRHTPGDGAAGYHRHA